MMNFLDKTVCFSYFHDTTIGNNGENNEKKENIFTSQAFLSLTTDLCCILHENGSIQEVSFSFLKVLGYSREEVLQRPLLNFIHPHDREQLNCLLSTHYKSGKKPTSVSYRLKKKNGRYIRTTSTSTMVINTDQQRHFFICSVNNTHELKQSQVIDHQRRQLEAYKEELENFTYLASHDLQEPLRVITSYLQLLEKRYKSQIVDQDASDFINYTVEGADRMKIMIGDLLVFSRINRKYQDEELVDMNKVLGDVKRKLKTEIKAHNVSIYADQLPKVTFNNSLMVHVWQNLISNAIKFRLKSQVKIDVCVKEQAKHWLISVNDNGMGIEKKYHQRIFEPFERLHGKKYAGTGMGLAIVKKIIERFGGRIWVKSQPWQGTTFYFTLRKS